MWKHKNWPENIIFKISVLFKHFEEETIPFLGHFAPKKLEYQESDGEHFLHNAGKEYKKRDKYRSSKRLLRLETREEIFRFFVTNIELDQKN